MRNLLALSVIVAFFSCGQVVKQNINKDIPEAKPIVYITPAGDKIVFIDEYYSSFLKGINSGNKNIDSLYQLNIADPILKYFTKCEYSDLVKYQFYYSYSIQDTTGLEYCLSEIDNNQEKIKKIISSTLGDCNHYLKNDSLTICIQATNKGIPELGGVAGLTAGRKQIILTIDPRIGTWYTMLKFTLAHEFNHAYWTKMNFNKSNHFTLLGYLIFEGKADSYAHFIYPKLSSWDDTSFSPQQQIDLWKRIKSKLDTEDIGFEREVMFGSYKNTAEAYPFLGGYNIGYAIVQSALKNHPELTPEEWTNLAPEKILEMSDYK